MTARPSHRCLPLLLVCLVLLAPVSAQSPCGTDQNPYCAGNDIFEQICCPVPNICYWADRAGSPGCCPYGQVCFGYQPPPNYTPPAQPAPQPIVTTITQAPQTSTVTQHGTPATPAQFSTITSYIGGGVVTVTEGAGGVFATVSGVLVSDASSSRLHLWTPLAMALLAVAFNLP